MTEIAENSKTVINDGFDCFQEFMGTPTGSVFSVLWHGQSSGNPTKSGYLPPAIVGMIMGLETHNHTSSSTRSVVVVHQPRGSARL